jgi:carbamoyltransferase
LKTSGSCPTPETPEAALALLPLRMAKDCIGIMLTLVTISLALILLMNLVRTLLDTGIVGVANGRAEFGPRALGNRSLLADPRGAEIKDRVNEIKRRQKFRPFAPVILAELADDYFDMQPGWHTHNYMQSVAHCRQPDVYPAICHVDGTSRVQTVAKDGSGIRQLLEAWYAHNWLPYVAQHQFEHTWGAHGQQDRADAHRFEYEYGVNMYYS